MEKIYLTVEELAKYLKVTKKTLYNWIWLRKIPYFKINGKILFEKNEVESWIKEHYVPEKNIAKL
jgi:excisionase family DNA binding protein